MKIQLHYKNKKKSTNKKEGVTQIQDLRLTRSRKCGIEAIKVLPFPFWTVMFNDLFCSEVISPMGCSNENKQV
jgi:hypothetical protein